MGTFFKICIAFLLAFLLTGPGSATGFAQVYPDRPLGGSETVQEAPPPSPAPAKSAPKEKSSGSGGGGSSPKQQIKEGGREIGQGFKDLGLGIGRGFQNMGRAFKKAWTGGKED